MRTARSIVIAALSLFLAISPALRAQGTELQPGARVRITAPGIVAGGYVGTILARTADTLVVGSPTSKPVSVALARLTSLEVSRGSSRALGAQRGMMWGTPIGLGLGALLIPAMDNCRSCDKRVAPVLIVYGLSGILYGAAIGALIGRERWESFDLEPHISIAPVPGGARVGISVRLPTRGSGLRVALPTAPAANLR